MKCYKIVVFISDIYNQTEEGKKAERERKRVRTENHNRKL